MGSAASPLSKSSGPVAIAAQTTRTGSSQGNTDPVIINIGGADPSSGAGIAAPVGSLAINTGGQVWLKNGAAATAWNLTSTQVTAVQRTLTTIPGGNGAGNVGDLNTSPQTVVAAPGAGFYVEVLSAHFFLDYAAATYDNVATLQLRYTNGAGAAILGTAVPSANLLTAAADAHVISNPVDNVVPVANAVVVAHASADPFAAAGDSPLLVEVWWRVRAAIPT